jgi:hypothetical protein
VPTAIAGHEGKELETSMTTPPAIVAADEEGIPTSKDTAVPNEIEVVVDRQGHAVDGEVVVAEHGHATARLALTVAGLNDDVHADDLPVLR